jgi:hypothetical protein
LIRSDGLRFVRNKEPLVTRFVPRFVIALFLLSIASHAASQPAAPFTIVVLSGEDSVNVIQQKTAVAPLVEVRDRNNNPMSGVMVTFAVEGGKSAAFQGGAATLTVATNAAGQAAATGLTPLTAGAVNISVEAAVQGQVVSAAISQVNVMTAAEAAAAAGGATGGAGSSAGAAGGGAAGGGGGISATTVGLLGGVAAAGAVVTTQVLGSDGDGSDDDISVFSARFSMNATLPFGNCARQENYSGTLELQLDSVSGPISGNAEIFDATSNVTATTCSGPITVGSIGRWGMPNGPVTGTESSLSFRSSDVVPALDGNGVTISRSFVFTGSLSGSSITGQIEMIWRNSQPNFPVMTMGTAITLTKQ